MEIAERWEQESFLSRELGKILQVLPGYSVATVRINVFISQNVIIHPFMYRYR